jgi:hypothetical protein
MDKKPSANNTQVGGDHYMRQRFRCDCGREHEHWDIAWGLKWDSFLYPITKYLWRWRDKGGVEDLKKARHYLDKYIEVNTAEEPLVPEEPPHRDPVIKHLHPYAVADAEQAALEEEEMLLLATLRNSVREEDEERPMCCNCLEMVRQDQTRWTCPAHGNLTVGDEV